MRTVVLAFLYWPNHAITFDYSNHPEHVPQPGWYPLIVNPIIGSVQPTMVMMDGESGLNIIYCTTFDAVGIRRDCLRLIEGPSHGIMPEIQDMSLG